MKPLFPISISPAAAHIYADGMSEYQVARRQRGAYIEEEIVYGDLLADGTLRLWAWACSDNGFCQQSGKYWEATIKIPNDKVGMFMQREVLARAILEIEAEDQARYDARVTKRAAEIKRKLDVTA